MDAHSRIVIWVAAIAVVVAGCEFDASGIPSILAHHAPLTKPTKESSKVVVHAPDQLFVVHGNACGESDLPDAVRIAGSLELPTTKFSGHVIYLNGWKLRFLNEESQLIGFGAGIGKSTIQGKDLSWEAVGGIGNEDQDQRIEFCYWYTALAWTDFMPNASTVQEDFADIRENQNGGHHSALLVVPRNLLDPGAEMASDTGVLPKGFGFLWADYDEDYFLQAAYRLGPGERYLYGDIRPDRGYAYQPSPAMPLPPPAGSTVDWVNKGFTSWDSTAIFKNGNSADAFRFGDLVVGFADDNLALLDPHFHVSPLRQVDLASSQPRQQVITVENVPFHFAAPVLNGWNLYLPIDDEQVREMGIWIDSFEYKRSGFVGNLTYQLQYAFEDDEGSICHWDPGVAVLGVKKVWPD